MIKRSSFVGTGDKTIPILHNDFDDHRPTVVVVLPFGMRMEMAHDLLERLDEDFNVATWQGRSLSDDPVVNGGEVLTPQTHVDDLFALLEHVRATRAHVIGFCSGAGIAVLAAATPNDIIDQLVLVCGEYMMGPDTCRQTNFQREVDQLLPMAAKGIEVASALAEKLSSSYGETPPRTEFDTELRMPFSSAAHLYRHGVNYVAYRDVDFLKLARQVPHPALLISTEQDQQVVGESSALMGAALQNIHEHLVLPGDHYALLRRDAAMTGAIVDFLASA